MAHAHAHTLHITISNLVFYSPPHTSRFTAHKILFSIFLSVCHPSLLPYTYTAYFSCYNPVVLVIPFMVSFIYYCKTLMVYTTESMCRDFVETATVFDVRVLDGIVVCVNNVALAFRQKSSECLVLRHQVRSGAGQPSSMTHHTRQK